MDCRLPVPSVGYAVHRCCLSCSSGLRSGSCLCLLVLLYGRSVVSLKLPALPLLRAPGRNTASRCGLVHALNAVRSLISHLTCAALLRRTCSRTESVRVCSRRKLCGLCYRHLTCADLLSPLFCADLLSPLFCADLLSPLFCADLLSPLFCADLLSPLYCAALFTHWCCADSPRLSV
jgi:hypothetical protein